MSARKAIDNTPEFARKARGIFNGDYASSLDGTAAKDSRYYNFFVTKEGDPSENITISRS